MKLKKITAICIILLLLIIFFIFVYLADREGKEHDGIYIYEFEIENNNNNNYTIYLPIPLKKNDEILPYKYSKTNLIEGEANLNVITTEKGKALQINSSSKILKFKEKIRIKTDDYKNSRLSMFSQKGNVDVEYYCWLYLNSSSNISLKMIFHHENSNFGHDAGFGPETLPYNLKSGWQEILIDNREPIE